MSSAPLAATIPPIAVNARVSPIDRLEGSRPIPHPKRVKRLAGGQESSNLPLPQPHDSGIASELALVRALTDRCAGSSPPPQVDVEQGLETGLARLMSLEGRLREQASRASGTRPSEQLCEDHDLAEQICRLRDAVAELRAHTNPGETAPLAQGFVLRRQP
jgi:hypothetical protein